MVANKEAPSPHKVGLTSVDTNSIFQYLSISMSQFQCLNIPLMLQWQMSDFLAFGVSIW